MNLPVNPTLPPMLAKRIAEIPAGEGWTYEPKWDGFRTLVFKDGNEIMLQSRDEKSLNRYFPEILEPLLRQLPHRCVLDGEIVIARDGALDFDALQLRIHPAASRVKRLSQETPASIVFFDLLALGDQDLRSSPFQDRRRQLVKLLASAIAPLYLTPATAEIDQASDWFRRFEGAGLDGVMAKPANLLYQPDKRVMYKVKHERDCDCVVGGFRWYRNSKEPAVGSLLLGLYDSEMKLQHVGVCGSFPMKTRLELVSFLEPYRTNALVHHPWVGDGDQGLSERIPGAQSRWSQGKDLSWEPLRISLVAEVAYDHLQGARFRHMAQFRRWRMDKEPRDCTYAQLEVAPPEELAAIFKQESAP